MVKEITILRHPHIDFADHNGNVDHDPEISDWGQRQLDNYIGMLPIGPRAIWDEIHSSYMRRSYKSAAEIALATRVPHIGHDWLRELDWDPDWDGKPYEEINPLFQQWKRSETYAEYRKGPGGNTESFEAHRTRVTEGLAKLLADTKAESVLILAHHLTLSVIGTELLGLYPHTHPIDLHWMSDLTFVKTPMSTWRLSA